MHPRGGIPPVSFLAPYGFTGPLTRTHVDSLVRVSRRAERGPAGRRPERAVPEGTPRRRAAASTIEATTSPRHDYSPGLGRRPNRCRSTPESIGGTGSSPSPHPTGRIAALIRFPPDNFKHSLTLFQSPFIFPRSTCLLSVSRPYLALDGIYRPIEAAFPNNPTRRQPRGATGSEHDGLSPSPALPSSGTSGPVRREDASPHYIRTAGPPDSQAGLFLARRRY